MCASAQLPYGHFIAFLKKLFKIKKLLAWPLDVFLFNFLVKKADETEITDH